MRGSGAWAASAAGATALAFGLVGADARWAAAMGGSIVTLGAVPEDVPFATASTAGWHDATALGQVVLHGVDSLAGDRGLVILQAAAVTIGFALLAAAARRRAGSRGTFVALALVLLGAMPWLVIARTQVFSIVLMPAVLLLLAVEAERPTRRIWLLPPLLALWANLHGAVLVGVGVATSYLLLERLRRRPVESVALLAAIVAATTATPSGPMTWAYFRGVMQNEAARRGQGMWAPLSLTSPWHVAFLLAFAGLVAMTLRARVVPPLWELAAAVGLLVMTVRAERTGVFLLFLAAPAAARGLRGTLLVGPRARMAAATALVALAAVGLVRGPLAFGASDAVVREALARAQGRAILAGGLLEEALVLDGGRIWVGNPIDAFRPRDQRTFLAWQAGEPAGDEARAHAAVVVVERGRGAERRVAADRRFALVGGDAAYALYARRSSTTTSPSR